MKLKPLGYAKLDMRIAEMGEDAVVMDVATRIAEGCNPKGIADNFGIPYIVLKQWLEGHGDMVALARRAHADILVSEALDEVTNAETDTVSVARLRAETYMKVAGKQDRIAWGESSQAFGSSGGNITIVIGSVEVPGAGKVVDMKDIEDSGEI
ncbi:MAG: hypothetical protein UW55_C0024G0004 [Candidatus Giovannonibacteria bacterium GW2011_GWA2_44_26]|uniref:Uncharacterized protein n=1 Tax=Candidatus Giovannonibacteria bacterium GW2011_GWA2_44_26 TaxID=1618648 RepID=A0A0G1KZJ8_9BACT|nr:MAG: hypothetical protein UW55_C0024G0004 [Candidatus Giovannonibacteria bacterium GW2011_GWA2_44_26]